MGVRVEPWPLLHPLRLLLRRPRRKRRNRKRRMEKQSEKLVAARALWTVNCPWSEQANLCPATDGQFLQPVSCRIINKRECGIYLHKATATNLPPQWKGGG